MYDEIEKENNTRNDEIIIKLFFLPTDLTIH